MSTQNKTLEFCIMHDDQDNESLKDKINETYR